MTSDFATLIPRAKQAGFIATMTAAAITAQFGWHLGKGYLEQISLAVLLALCTVIVGYALTFAFHAYRARMQSVGHAAVALFAIAVAVEFLSHTGFTAANRDATIAGARLQQTNTTFDIGNVDALAKEVARLTQRLNMRPVRNAEQAQAAIDNAMAHRFWSITDGCKATKGAQTREFCSSYASAVADKAGATEAVTIEAELKQAKAAYEQARSRMSTTKVATSSAASQGVVLASMLSMDENPSNSAVFWAGVGISSLLALFAICAGGLLNYIAFAFESATSRTVPPVEHRHAPPPKDRWLIGHMIRGENGIARPATFEVKPA